MRLADYLRVERPTLIRHWIAYAAQLAPAGAALDEAALRDDAGELLDAVADAVEQPPGTPTGPRVTEYAIRHAQVRLSQGFALTQVVSEYRAMRADVLQGWIAGAGDAADVTSIVRFGEAIDESLAESIAWYEARVSRARELFLGMLGHDLRTPVGAISLSAQALMRDDRLQPAAVKVAVRIFNSANRLRDMLDDLLDFTRTRLGGALSHQRRWSDLGPPLLHTVEELRALNPLLPIVYHATGQLTGDWDVARLCQVVQNLGGNAAQHGGADGVVTITVLGEDDAVTLSVHNTGAPIPAELLPHVFDPLMRGLQADEEPQGTRSHLGLGLYICRQIVEAHGGTLSVRSDADDGTCFTARLPRQSQAPGTERR